MDESARPKIRWWIPGAQATAEELKAELRSMKDAGFLGAEICSMPYTPPTDPEVFNYRVDSACLHDNPPSPFSQNKHCQPFTAPPLIPSTIWEENRKYSTMMGISVMITAAMDSPICLVNCPMYW